MKRVCANTQNWSILLVIFILTGTHNVSAQDHFAQWFNPRLGQLKLQGSYQIEHFFSRDIKGQESDIRWTQQELDILIPLKQNDVSEWALLSELNIIDIDSNAVLSDTLEKLPSHLWSMALGGAYRRRLNNDWIAGAQLTIGSTSDKPFDSAEELVVNALGTLQIPHGPRNAWLLMLQYSNNREFLQNVPIPGVAYLWQPDRTFRALLGIPFAMIHWEPATRWSVDASYMIPRTIRAKIQYEITNNVSLYSGFTWQNQRFFRADRPDDDERLFFYDKRVLAGLQWQLTEQLLLDLQAGFAFDRFIFEGQDYSDRSHNRINIQNGCFFGIQNQIRF
ncbi:MAG: hypothetical protein JXD22_10580 [Sedimentisphaerales bacterium]|nr:hypothetical protein [Sedimentisphaerales bacterium]